MSIRAQAASDLERENRLRAGYLYNMAKYVEWPASAPASQLSVCFLGAAGVREALDAGFGDKPIGVRRILIRAITAKDSVSGCQIVYVDANAAPTNILVGGEPPTAVLTLGELPDFVRRGGIVELFEADNHLRFNVNLGNARRAGLKISSNLLQLASRVDESSK